MGPDAILAEGDQIWANPDIVASDVQTFRRDLEAGRPAEALERYRGNFLDGFHLAGLPEFEEWMAVERNTLRRSAVKAAWNAAAHAEAAEDREGALRYARRALDLAPLEEEGTRRLMALHLRYGDRSGAVQAFEALARTMEAELGVEPSPETREALEAVRRGHPSENLLTPLQALAENGAVREAESAADRGDEAGVSAEGSSPGVKPGTGPVEASRLSPKPPHPAGRDRRRPLRWAASGAVVLGAFLVVTSVAWDASPPVTEGTVAVVNDASPAPRSEQVAARLVEILSGADFPAGVLNPPAGEGEALAGRLREEGIEALLRLDDAPGGMRATLFRVIDGRLLGTVVLPDSLDEGAAADRAAGLAALHLDRRLASWSDASSVVPGYRAFQAFHEAMAAWRDGRNQDPNPALERAVALEPWFPLALLELAGRELARTPPVDSLLHRVAAERPHLSEVEQLFLVYLEAEQARNLMRQYDAARSLAKRVPERFVESAAHAALHLGRYEEALSLATPVPTVPSPFLPIRVPAGVPLAALHALGRHEEELEMARELGGDWVNFEVNALVALGRVEEIQALLRKRAAQPAFPGLAAADLNVRAAAILELRLHGYEDEARILIDEGLRFLESPAGEDMGLIVRIRFHRAAGRLDDWERTTRESLDRALREIPEWSGRYTHIRDLGLIAAARGDLEAALDYEAQVAAFAKDTTVAFHPRDYARIMASRARIHAALGNEEDAVHLLTRALALGLSHFDIRAAPEFARLRGNPDFDQLVPAPTF